MLHLFSSARAAIVGLLNGCGPAAICGRVRAVVVDAVKAHAARPDSHISVEVLERMQPTVANRNTTSTVICPSSVSRVVTAAKHMSPNAVFSRYPTFTSHPVRNFSSAAFRIRQQGIAVASPALVVQMAPSPCADNSRATLDRTLTMPRRRNKWIAMRLPSLVVHLAPTAPEFAAMVTAFNGAVGVDRLRGHLGLTFSGVMGRAIRVAPSSYFTPKREGVT